jgi:adenylate cyclase
VTPRRAEGALAFTDLVGFTDFTALNGDEAAYELLERQRRAVDGCLPEDARMVKHLGDGLLLWFSSVADALTTCLASDGWARPLGVRAGLHWGAPLVWEDDLVGHDVNLTARIVTVAAPGEVLVSEAARDRLPGAALDEVGPVVMKGIGAPVRLFRAVP